MKLTRQRRLATALVAFALALPTMAIGAEAPCNGDECQGPPPAPEEVIPATAVVEGPPNPPVHFEKQHHPKSHTHKGKAKGKAKSGAKKRGRDSR